jgi:hypothetical protein
MNTIKKGTGKYYPAQLMAFCNNILYDLMLIRTAVIYCMPNIHQALSYIFYILHLLSPLCHGYYFSNFMNKGAETWRGK